MKLLAIDSNSILNRAFYGIKTLSTRDGLYTNGIFGFLKIFQKLMADTKPDCVAMAFDLRAPTFRHKMYDGYKAQRKGMPEELAVQLPYLKDLIRALGYRIVEMEGFEADDILGTLGRQCTEDGDTCVIATGDRDSLQLVNAQVSVLLATSHVGKAEYIVHTPSVIKEKYGVMPRQLIDVKALMGDASDNIPGVAGIGEKTALSLIAKFHSLEEVYANLEDPFIKPGMRAKLEAGREMAELSRKLAEIDCHVPIEFDPSLYKPADIDHAAAYAILTKLEMYKMIERFGINTQAEPSAPENMPETVRELQFLHNPSTGEISSMLEGMKEIYLYCVFQGDTAAEVAFCGETSLALVDGEQCAPVLGRLLESGLPIRGHDFKRLYRFAMLQHSTFENPNFDTALAAYLLSPNSTEYSMNRLQAEYGVRRFGISDAEFADDEAVRACTALPELYRILDEKIRENQQEELLHGMEIPLSEVLASMELTGFEIDIKGIEEFGKELEEEAARLQNQIYEQAGYEFNINSPKQLGEVLFIKLGLPAGKKTKNGYSTNVDVLDNLKGAHPIVNMILEFRKQTKLKSTYVDGLLKVVGEDGRIHSSFNQTETRTGRISSTEPNMQNIPIRTELGSRLRKYFRAKEGDTLVDADYSQIELRVLASISGDENLIGAFLAGEDIHTTTASQVFDMPPLYVTPLMRSRAKAVNFGIVYGIGAFSLSGDIGVSISEADQYIKNYLRTYSGVKTYMDNTKKQAAEQGYVTTLFYRRRYLPELASSNKNIRSFGERVAMNTPIQGTAADIIKIAMIRVYRRLKQENMASRLILQVHDELIVEAPEAEAEKACRVVREEMENAVALKVPLTADVNTGKTWYETK